MTRLYNKMTIYYVEVLLLLNYNLDGTKKSVDFLKFPDVYIAL